MDKRLVSFDALLCLAELTSSTTLPTSISPFIPSTDFNARYRLYGGVLVSRLLTLPADATCLRKLRKFPGAARASSLDRSQGGWLHPASTEYFRLKGKPSQVQAAAKRCNVAASQYQISVQLLVTSLPLQKQREVEAHPTLPSTTPPFPILLHVLISFIASSHCVLART